MGQRAVENRGMRNLPAFLPKSKTCDGRDDRSEQVRETCRDLRQADLHRLFRRHCLIANVRSVWRVPL
jgi:hypothetical protein